MRLNWAVLLNSTDLLASAEWLPGMQLCNTHTLATSLSLCKPNLRPPLTWPSIPIMLLLLVHLMTLLMHLNGLAIPRTLNNGLLTSVKLDLAVLVPKPIPTTILRFSLLTSLTLLSLLNSGLPTCLTLPSWTSFASKKHRLKLLFARPKNLAAPF